MFPARKKASYRKSWRCDISFFSMEIRCFGVFLVLGYNLSHIWVFLAQWDVFLPETFRKNSQFGFFWYFQLGKSLFGTHWMVPTQTISFVMGYEEYRSTTTTFIAWIFLVGPDKDIQRVTTTKHGFSDTGRLFIQKVFHFTEVPSLSLSFLTRVL